jgi:hypothetical protein
MRDTDLAVRAQQAAAELERAWDRWRNMHGLGTDPLPPVSSYVGYSLEEPWGQPRVVFGIDAREAEQLAALLDRHDCAGPVYAAVASMAGARTGDAADARAADADRYPGAGRVRVPTQAPPGAAQRGNPPEPAQPDPLLGPLEPSALRDGGPRDGGPRESMPRESMARESMARESMPRESMPRESMPRQGGPRQGRPQDQDDLGPAAGATEVREPSARHDVSAPKEDQGTEEAQPGPADLAAFRPQHEPAGYSGEGQDPAPFLDEPEQDAEPGRATAGWTRAGRVPGGHALPRQKRAGGAARGASSTQED